MKSNGETEASAPTILLCHVSQLRPLLRFTVFDLPSFEFVRDPVVDQAAELRCFGELAGMVLEGKSHARHRSCKKQDEAPEGDGVRPFDKAASEATVLIPWLLIVR